MQSRIYSSQRFLKRLVVGAAATFAVSSGAFAASAQATVYSVIGTQGRGLNVRSAPSLGGALVTNLRDGTPLDVVCQIRGDNVMGSTMWDKIDGPTTGYVADYYTTTPVFNGPSPGLSACGSAPPPTPAPPSSPTPSGSKALAVAAAAESYNGRTEIPAAFASRYRIGPHWSGFCESFVALVAYGGRGLYGTAYSDYLSRRNAGLIHQGVPPRGAIVYWNPSHNLLGHIGVSLGGGREISTYGYYGNDYPIQEHSYTYFGAYLGWAMPY